MKNRCQPFSVHAVFQAVPAVFVAQQPAFGKLLDVAVLLYAAVAAQPVSHETGADALQAGTTSQMDQMLPRFCHQIPPILPGKETCRYQGILKKLKAEMNPRVVNVKSYLC